MKWQRSRAKRAKLVVASLAGILFLYAGVAVAAVDAPLSIQRFDSTEYPGIKMVVTLPPSISSGSNPSFTVKENGDQIRGVSSARVESKQTSVRVVLLVDTSGSMRGTPLKDAKAAATRFVGALGQGAQVAIIAFSDKPHIVAPFTDSRSALNGAIGTLSAGGETALYDGLASSAQLVAPLQSSSRTSIVILSDGGDTVSSAKLSQVLSRFKGLNTPVYAVALKSKDYNPSALGLLTSSTNGHLVSASDSQQLAQLFQGIAKEISAAWSISYLSKRPRTADIDVDVSAQAGESQASAKFAYPNPAILTRAAAPITFPSMTDDPRLLGLVAALAFIAVAMLSTGVLLLAVRDRNTLGQLRFYDQLHAHDTGELSVGPGSTAGVPAAIVDAVGTIAQRRGLTDYATHRLEAAGLPLRASEYMTIHLFAVIGLGVLTQLLVGSFALSAVVILLTTMAPLIAIDIATDKRRRRFDEQLPDVLSMIAGSLRGGWGIQQAIGLAAQESPPPMGPELRRVETETRLGLPLERALQSMADRVGSADFEAAVGAIAIQREVGGNLAEVLDLVARTVREREAMRRQVKALTAEGRLSAWILIALPFVITAILLITSPSYLVPMFTSVPGIAMLLVGAVLLIIGSIWLYRVTKIEV